MVEHIFRRVVLDAPAHKSFVSDMDVDVVHRGHDRLAGQIDVNGAGGRFDGAFGADSGNVPIADDEGPVLNRRGGVADNQARAFYRSLHSPAHSRYGGDDKSK